MSCCKYSIALLSEASLEHEAVSCRERPTFLAWVGCSVFDIDCMYTVNPELEDLSVIETNLKKHIPAMRSYICPCHQRPPW